MLLLKIVICSFSFLGDSMSVWFLRKLAEREGKVAWNHAIPFQEEEQKCFRNILGKK